MIKTCSISLIAVALISTIVWAAESTSSKKSSALREDYPLAGADGNLVSPDSNGKWFFQFDSDLKDGLKVIPAGTPVEILPSSMLEKITADVNERSDKMYRLWGKLTKYDGKNFIFPLYFLPMSKIKQLSAQGEASPPVAPPINEPNEELRIPEEIVKKLMPTKVIRTEELKKGLKLEQDSILADRTGLIEKQPNGEFAFVLDALGWNIQKISFPLLSCQALEKAFSEQSSKLSPPRLKVAGIVTKYKGKNYLLLQRAAPSYSYGNF